MGLNPEKNPAQTVVVPAQPLLGEIILSSFARPGLWPSESLGCSYTLRAWFPYLKGAWKLMTLTVSRGAFSSCLNQLGWVLGTESLSPHCLANGSLGAARVWILKLPGPCAALPGQSVVTETTRPQASTCPMEHTREAELSPLSCPLVSRLHQTCTFCIGEKTQHICL